MAESAEQQTLPASLRFVLTAARAGAGDQQALAELAPGLAAAPADWAQVAEMAAHHRVFPLLLEGLERAGKGVLEQLPPAVLEDLRAARKQNAMRAILFSLEAQRLMRTLRESGARTSVLKGTPLSTMLYGDPSLRHVGDLDLLIDDGAAPADRLEKHIGQLEALGFNRVNPACRLTPLRLASYRMHWKDMTFESTRGGPVLELHWRLFNNRLHGANRLTEADTEPCVVYGATIPAMPRVEQFVYAAAHGGSDEWVYLKGLVDIATFLRVLSAAELDAAFVLAQRLGLAEQLSSAVHLARLWMGATATHRLLLPASNAFHRVMLKRLVERLRAADFQPERQQLGALDAMGLELRLVPGIATVAEIVARFLWRPRIWSAHDLADRWFWLYPFLGLVTLPRRG